VFYLVHKKIGIINNKIERKKNIHKVYCKSNVTLETQSEYSVDLLKNKSRNFCFL
jgi:hypothetical protein